MVPERRSSDQPRTVGDCDDRWDAHRATLIRCTCWAIGILLVFLVVPGVGNAIHQAMVNSRTQTKIENLEVDVSEIKEDVKQVLYIVKNGER